jgi:hypothetical protein
MADLNLKGSFDCAFCDPYSGWDWVPNSGYIPFIQCTNDHQIAVTLETPLGMQPSETTVFHATVYNYGQNTEATVNFKITINGTVVSSTTIPSLAIGAPYVLSYIWTPTIEGFYNVTAYASLVTNENAARTRLTTVMYKIALISDNTELSAIQPTLDLMGINYDVYSYNYYNFFTQNLN